MKGYKAFNEGMKCRDKQYAENTVYEEEGGKICSAGMMHFCKEPYNVFHYYNVMDRDGLYSEFADVEALGRVAESDTKCATDKIKIGSKIDFKEYIEKAAEAIADDTKCISGHLTDDVYNDDELNHIVGTFYSGMKIGCIHNNTIIGAPAGNTAISSSGRDTVILSSGSNETIASSGESTEICCTGNSNIISSSGDYTKISNFGDNSIISCSGESSVIRAEGSNSIVSVMGPRSKASGKIGDWLVIAEWRLNDDCRCVPVCIKAGQVDGKFLKENVLYRVRDGEFEEV